jgi:hypothetical protein
MIDPIVEEIHKIREEFAEKHNYDIDAMFEEIHQKQKDSRHKIVSFVKDKEDGQISEEKKVA